MNDDLKCPKCGSIHVTMASNSQIDLGMMNCKECGEVFEAGMKSILDSVGQMTNRDLHDLFHGVSNKFKESRAKGRKDKLETLEEVEELLDEFTDAATTASILDDGVNADLIEGYDRIKDALDSENDEQLETAVEDFQETLEEAEEKMKQLTGETDAMKISGGPSTEHREEIPDQTPVITLPPDPLDGGEGDGTSTYSELPTDSQLPDDLADLLIDKILLRKSANG